MRKRVAALAALASLLIMATASCGSQAPADAGTTGGYTDGKDYAATADMVPVQAKWPDVPELTDELRGRLRPARDLAEGKPSEYTGARVDWQNSQCGQPTVVLGVPKGGTATAAAKLAEKGITPGCASHLIVSETEQSTAQQLFTWQDEILSLPHVSMVSVDWSRHVLVVTVDEITDDLRKQMKSTHGNDVVLDLDPSKPGVRADR